MKSTLECSYCQYQSITFDMFWDLSIPLPRVSTFLQRFSSEEIRFLPFDMFIEQNKSSTTVQECLQLFMSKEELNGDEKPVSLNRCYLKKQYIDLTC